MTTRRPVRALASLCCLAMVLVAAELNAAERKHTVDFRLTRWRTVHLDDAKKADTHFKTLKGLGCEVKKEVHNGHVDVTYRVVKWRTASFKTDKEAHQWQDYFKGMGFETRHKH